MGIHVCTVIYKLSMRTVGEIVCYFEGKRVITTQNVDTNQEMFSEMIDQFNYRFSGLLILISIATN